MKDNKVVITTDVTRVSAKYAENTGVSEDEALRIFLGSATYRSLINVETGLCYEMFDAIYDMFIDEVSLQ